MAVGPVRRQHAFFSHWCVLLEFHLRRKRLSASALAQRLGRSQQAISGYLVGRAKPPLDDMGTWADALGLADPERQQFLDAAYEAYTPTRVWARVVELSAAHAARPLPEAKVAADLDRCREVVAELVSVLVDVERVWFTRDVPVGDIPKVRAKIGVLTRRAIERYSKGPGTGNHKH